MKPVAGNPAVSMGSGDTRSELAIRLVLLGLACWLLLAVLLVHLELDDGYTTIANAQHFLGISDGYFWQRAPLMAWLLVPAEWLAPLPWLRRQNFRPRKGLFR